MKIFFFFILATLFLQQALAAGKIQFSNKLSLQWPPAVCKSPKGCNAAAASLHVFRIHGLWPDIPSKLPPKFQCLGDVRADIDAVLKHEYKVREKMEEMWPSLEKVPSNLDLWKNEWRKHGRCTMPFMGVTTYFDRTIGLYVKVSNEDILKKAGIKAGEEYTEKDLKAKLNAWSYKPEVLCLRLGKGAMLLEMRFCVNPAGTSIINCVDAELINCESDSGMIKFL